MGSQQVTYSRTEHTRADAAEKLEKIEQQVTDRPRRSNKISKALQVETVPLRRGGRLVA